MIIQVNKKNQVNASNNNYRQMNTHVYQTFTYLNFMPLVADFVDSNQIQVVLGAETR